MRNGARTLATSRWHQGKLTELSREHEAHDVYVTGSFDDWRKTIQLEKEDGIFQKTVELPKTKHQYKVCFTHSPACRRIVC